MYVHYISDYLDWFRIDLLSRIATVDKSGNDHNNYDVNTESPSDIQSALSLLRARSTSQNLYFFFEKVLLPCPVVVKSVPALFAVLSLVLCFESENKCNDFMLVATRMLRYSASRHFSRVRCTFSFLQNF